MKIVSSAKLTQDIQDYLKDTYPNLSFLFHSNMKEAEDDLYDAEVLLTYGEDLTEALVDQAKQLKWVMVISAGLDKMPFEALKKRKILVTNARGIHKIPMAEYAMGVILQTAKNMKQWHRNEQKHKWDRRVKMNEINGKVLAIIGTGAIGSEIARLAKAFNMTTLGVNRSGLPVDNIDTQYTQEQLNDVLPQADYVVSILPSTNETYHFFKKEQFKLMKSSAVFINIGRGKTVLQEDLLDALQRGIIGHAVLDVFEEEPLNENHPFWEMEQVTITPHFSAITDQYQPRALTIFEKNLNTYLNKGITFVNKIDLDRGY